MTNDECTEEIEQGCGKMHKTLSKKCDFFPLNAFVI